MQNKTTGQTFWDTTGTNCPKNASQNHRKYSNLLTKKEPVRSDIPKGRQGAFLYRDIEVSKDSK